MRAQPLDLFSDLTPHSIYIYVCPHISVYIGIMETNTPTENEEFSKAC